MPALRNLHSEGNAMWQQPDNDQFVDELLLAGQKAAPGLYRELGTGRLDEMAYEEPIPATLDGRIACYVKISNLWGQTASVVYANR